MQYQDLTSARKLIERMYANNPNRSISATFRTLRKKSYISFIGDYPILAKILDTLACMYVPFSRNRVWHAFIQSEELKSLSRKEKIDLLDELINLSNDQIQSTKNLPYHQKKENMNIASAHSKSNDIYE